MPSPHLAGYFEAAPQPSPSSGHISGSLRIDPRSTSQGVDQIDLGIILIDGKRYQAKIISTTRNLRGDLKDDNSATGKTDRAFLRAQVERMAMAEAAEAGISIGTDNPRKITILKDKTIFSQNSSQSPKETTNNGTTTFGDFKQSLRSQDKTHPFLTQNNFRDDAACNTPQIFQEVINLATICPAILQSPQASASGAPTHGSTSGRHLPLPQGHQASPSRVRSPGSTSSGDLASPETRVELEAVNPGASSPGFSSSGGASRQAVAFLPSPPPSAFPPDSLGFGLHSAAQSLSRGGGWSSARSQEGAPYPFSTRPDQSSAALASVALLPSQTAPASPPQTQPHEPPTADLQSAAALASVALLPSQTAPVSPPQTQPHEPPAADLQGAAALASAQSSVATLSTQAPRSPASLEASSTPSPRQGSRAQMPIFEVGADGTIDASSSPRRFLPPQSEALPQQSLRPRTNTAESVGTTPQEYSVFVAFRAVAGGASLARSVGGALYSAVGQAVSSITDSLTQKPQLTTDDDGEQASVPIRSLDTEPPIQQAPIAAASAQPLAPQASASLQSAHRTSTASTASSVSVVAPATTSAKAAPISQVSRARSRVSWSLSNPAAHSLLVEGTQ
jgi:hypothetical protein